MNLLKITGEALSIEEITDHLRRLRHNALIESSHFAVSTILELRLVDGSFAYVSGVNVENTEHNRLGMHAEQNAIVAAQSLFGAKIKFSKAWLMGAPDNVEVGSESPLANNFITPCGHCRQILLSFSTPETALYSVTVNGAVAPAETLLGLLPKAFSERDLETTSEDMPSPAPATGRLGLFAEAPTPSPSRFLKISTELTNVQIRGACATIKPHVIVEGFKTSQITACMIKVADEGSFLYFPGALVQDIAFLTTDPVFSSIGQAVTEFGGSRLKIQEVNLYGSSLAPDQLSGSELHHLARFSTLETRFKFHTREETSPVYTLSDCLDVFTRKLLEDVASRTALEAHDCVVVFS
ncbi:MAG: hypothetical protein NTW94_05810 [Legionellales bacterium]|nr:hypothetical protein [Legionellales bacterium]